MRIDIISANVNILESVIKNGLIGRAISGGYIEIHLHNLRDYSEGNYRQIDDSLYGGGAGMVLKPEPFFKCISELTEKNVYDEIIYFSPQGKLFDQKMANNYSLKNNILILAGHYKGIDQRVIDKFVTSEISIGEYVLSCGDIASLVFADAVARLIPGVLNDAESALTDSFQDEEIFDAPVYTKPEIYEGLKVPEILLSGNHKLIAEWRKEKGKENYNKYISKNNSQIEDKNNK
ncbi:MAG: tRNA (guanosine(37)-N1)-methyltransferase TrmD [Ignavibacteria bacterium]|nr:tRNA (guanosine(37)-N1)-methyltransferase TrmD [Ignavibacteria bacterium]